MSSNLRHEIYNRMNLKDTDELLEIWQKNDRVEWSDVAFDVVREILQEREVNLPDQGQPIQEHIEEEVAVDNKSYGFSEEELKIIDDENPPEFYDPFEVLITSKRIDQMAKVMFVFTVIYNVINYRNSMGLVQSYFPGSPNSIPAYVLTIGILSLNIGIAVIITYYPLKALSHILRTLMEMEFRSRKVP